MQGVIRAEPKKMTRGELLMLRAGVAAGVSWRMGTEGTGGGGFAALRAACDEKLIPNGECICVCMFVF